MTDKHRVAELFELANISQNSKIMGGIFAEANLRGDGEYAEDWHQQGMLTRKQNVFDDFIAAAEYLIDNKYTSPEKLAIAVGSNG